MDVAMMPVAGSSHVQAVGYDEDTQAMVVEYKGGVRYQWSDVSAEDYRGVLDAASPGSYLRHHVEQKYGNGQRI